MTNYMGRLLTANLSVKYKSDYQQYLSRIINGGTKTIIMLRDNRLNRFQHPVTLRNSLKMGRLPLW